MPTRRGTSNTAVRGSSYSRRARKAWLLENFDPDLGPDKARCSFGCGEILTIETITVDRYPIPGCQGGTYRRDNIRPACGHDNSSFGATLRKTVET